MKVGSGSLQVKRTMWSKKKGHRSYELNYENNDSSCPKTETKKNWEEVKLNTVKNAETQSNG